jgi:hypothetical protein
MTSLRVTVLKAAPTRSAGAARGIQDQRLTALVDCEVAQAVRPGRELTAGPARQPGQRAGGQVQDASLGGELPAAGHDVDQDIQIRAGVRVNRARGREGDDVGVQIAVAGLQFPDRSRPACPGPVRLGDPAEVGGVQQDPGQRGTRELADPDTPRLGSLSDVFPAVAASVVSLELVSQVPGVVAVDQHECVADGESPVCGEDRRVLVGLAQRPYVEFLLSHRVSLGA